MKPIFNRIYGKRRLIYIIIAFLIAILPLNRLRIFFYRLIFRYDIDSSAKIGFGTIIVVDFAKIDHSDIGKFNKFDGPCKLEIQKGASIGAKNIFKCDTWILESQYKTNNYLAHCYLGKNVMITTKHFFDTSGGFVLQDRTWIAGRESQFWSHGAKVKNREISIGKDCYIGSAVRFAPGTIIANNCIIGLGSVVTDKFYEDNLFIAGVPAKIIKKNYDWKSRQAIGLG